MKEKLSEDEDAMEGALERIEELQAKPDEANKKTSSNFEITKAESLNFVGSGENLKETNAQLKRDLENLQEKNLKYEEDINKKKSENFACC